MEEIYENCSDRFIRIKGMEKYNTLCSKVSNSNEFAKFSGLTIQKGLPPTAQDFITCVVGIWYVFRKFDQATNTMAALIALRLWNNKVNEKYHLVSEMQIFRIAQYLESKW